MKKLICFCMLILVFVSAAFAQTGDVSTGTDYDSMIATFAGFAGCVVLLTEGIKALFPKMNGLLTQLVSWCVGMAAAMLLWWRIRVGHPMVYRPALRFRSLLRGERDCGYGTGSMAYRPYR